MRHHGIAAFAVAGMVATLVYAWPQQPPPPEFGVGPEMIDWNAGWFGSVFSFLSSTLIIGLVILLMRWISGLWHRVSSSRYIRPRRT
jgi:hypothetical protein